ncbi:MAG TPA: amidohydrolase [Polyangiaceae bacterium]|nr:amidohydrolase [Polyangiaceae bacterium]
MSHETCVRWCLIFFFAVACRPAHAPEQPPVDFLVVNAHIVTMNPRQPSAGALAVAGDRIVWMGGSEEARQRYPSISPVDLAGATVIPGIIDAHTHLLSLGESLIKINLQQLPNESAIVERIRQQAATTPRGHWILGWGWDEGKWAASYPTNAALSAATPDHPVFLVGLHSFAGWANAKALEIAGVTRQTSDPPKGAIVRDPGTGTPTGILINHAQELVTRHLPKLTLEQTKRAIELAAEQCVQHGLTSVHEAQVSRIMIEAYRELVRERRLPVRVAVMLDGADRALIEEWLARGPEIDARHRLTIRSVKIFADGALGSRGAALLEPYSDEPSTRGVFTTPGDVVYDITRRSLDRGFQVATYAIGDAANHEVLDAYERALGETKVQDARLRIEHAQIVAPSDLPRFAKLGVIASMQPTHCTSDMPWAEKRVGPSRVQGAYAWHSMVESGAHVPLSSDFPGETLDPFHGIYAAITRQSPDGKPDSGWHPEERLTLDEALRGYTREAAYAEFEERDKGSLEVGKLADFLVLSADITKVSPKEMLELRAQRTYVGGKLVFQAPQ